MTSRDLDVYYTFKLQKRIFKYFSYKLHLLELHNIIWLTAKNFSLAIGESGDNSKKYIVVNGQNCAFINSLCGVN
jgi:hypothetical protein